MDIFCAMEGLRILSMIVGKEPGRFWEVVDFQFQLMASWFGFLGSSNWMGLLLMVPQNHPKPPLVDTFPQTSSSPLKTDGGKVGPRWNFLLGFGLFCPENILVSWTIIDWVWWFHNILYFSSLTLGKWSNLTEKMFQMGWFNHHLVDVPD